MEPDIGSSSLQTPVDVAEYLFKRLYPLGVRVVQGVPGDYNLAALDYILKAGFEWVGNCNKLNAGYLRNFSAIVTTFGVGELSALNAIAGAFSEHVPVVHIVGQPTISSHRDSLLLHHTLGNSDYNVFSNISAKSAVATVKISDPHHAPALSDHASRECWIQSRPVEPYNKVEKRKLRGSCGPGRCWCDSPLGPGVVHEPIQKSGFPTFVAPMGQGADGTLPQFGGVYSEDSSHRPSAGEYKSCRPILSIGPLKSDFNTTGFSYKTNRLNTGDIYMDLVQVRCMQYPDVRMRESVPTTCLRIRAFIPCTPELIGPRISHSWLWPAVCKWLREGDVLVTETGTAHFGILETRFPKGVTAIRQILFMICNGGYKIERYIHGAKRRNTMRIQPWEHGALVKSFRPGCQGDYSSYHIRTRDELEGLFHNPKFPSAPHLSDDAPAALKLTAAEAAARKVQAHWYCPQYF
ncbi:thiamine diphosphate-binding protein [Aspergillus fruticulosus]